MKEYSLKCLLLVQTNALTEQEDFIGCTIKLDSIQGYFMTTENEINLIVSGQTFTILYERNILDILEKHFGDVNI